VASIYFDRELEARIKKFTTMFEPLMIVFVGAVVGFVAIALVQAMYGVLDNMKDQNGVNNG
jgi:type IV pilus assembly protein PilC